MSTFDSRPLILLICPAGLEALAGSLPTPAASRIPGNTSRLPSPDTCRSRTAAASTLPPPPVPVRHRKSPSALFYLPVDRISPSSYPPAVLPPLPAPTLPAPSPELLLLSARVLRARFSGGRRHTSSAT